MRNDETAEDLLSRPGALAIILCLLHLGPQTLRDLEATVGVQSSTIRYHLQALREAKLVVTEIVGGLRRTRLIDPDGMARLLDKAKPHWRQGSIPTGKLWREVQAGIDKRRARKSYRNRL
ncbi:MAG: helix-turn-helix domain-containing protein [Candidatus Thermoplasmatota archaeon]|jgi:DNA-binding transcriptional ArsR family regulator